MAYTPHDWETGEVITEERLDYMENGIADASAEVFTVRCTLVEGVPEGTWIVTSDKTAIEIYNAIKAGKYVNLLTFGEDTPDIFTTMSLNYAVKRSVGEGAPDVYMVQFGGINKTNTETQINLGFSYLSFENNDGGADTITYVTDNFTIDLAGN